jgi:hypothetical protein
VNRTSRATKVVLPFLAVTPLVAACTHPDEDPRLAPPPLVSVAKVSNPAPRFRIQPQRSDSAFVASVDNEPEALAS